MKAIETSLDEVRELCFELSPFHLVDQSASEQKSIAQQLRERYSELERQANLATAKTAKLLRELKGLSESTGGAIQRIEGFAFRDNLTGLANRHLLTKLLETVCKVCRDEAEVVIMLVDVDRFQIVNEVLGEAAGDHLLKEIGERLSSLASHWGAVGRTDGDEFMLVMEGVPSAQVDQEFALRAGRVRECLARPFLFKGQTFEMTVSIGGSSFPGRSEFPRELLNQAESALAHIKSQGRDRALLFTESLCAELRYSATLDLQMLPSLRKQEFTMRYRPIFRVPRGEPRVLVGVTSSLVWEHKVLGALGQELFRPVAERNGMALPLGYHALEMMCEDLVRWGQRGADFFCLLSLSGRQLLESDFAFRACEVVRKNGLMPAQIVFSLEESLVTLNEERIEQTIERLSEIGFNLALESFGSRHFSLARLARAKMFRLCPSILYADKTFLAQLVRVVSGLQCESVAVGVNSQEDVDTLTEVGCVLAEGDFYSPSLTATELLKAFSKRPE